MFPDPKIDTELMVLIFVAETKVSCLLAASPESVFTALFPVLVPDVA
jgi:hypothetical protein